GLKVWNDIGEAREHHVDLARHQIRGCGCDSLIGHVDDVCSRRQFEHLAADVSARTAGGIVQLARPGPRKPNKFGDGRGGSVWVHREQELVVRGLHYMGEVLERVVRKALSRVWQNRYCWMRGK